MRLRVRRPKSRLALAVSAAAGLIAATVAGMAIHGPATTGPTLVAGADGSTKVTMGNVGADQYRSADFGSVCLNEPGEVTIRSIEPVDPRGGLKVTDFSTVPVEQAAAKRGASGGRLRDEPAYRGTKLVTHTCSDPATSVNLFVELYKPGPQSATARAYKINYESSGRDRTADLLFGFGLCERSGCEIN